jgi:hypothetical protein
MIEYASTIQKKKIGSLNKKRSALFRPSLGLALTAQ